jgi:hypothetical protein
MMKRNIKLVLLAVLMAVAGAGFLAGNAHALAFDDKIVIERVKDDTFFWSAVVSVTPIVPEITGRYHDIDLDAGVPQIDVLYTEPGGFAQANFNGFRFWDMTNTVDDFENVSIWSSNLLGFDESRVSFNSDNIYMNFEGLTFDAGNFVSLRIGDQIAGISRNLPSSSVPEPGTIILVGSGLLGLTGLSRRKFKNIK